jgi:opacity protein-like surface antigen
MVRSSVTLAIAIAAFALAADAYAEDTSNNQTAPGEKSLTASDGWYFSGSAGMSFLEEQTNRSHSGSVDFDTSGANPGFDVTGALGKNLGDGFRAEGELGYRQIELGHATVYAPGGTGIASGSTSGNSHAVSFMGNGYYDFKQLGGPVVPYVGAGIGMADVSMDGVSVNGSPAVNDSDLVFAYQAMAGVGYQLTPTDTIYTGYRYFATAEPGFTDSAGDHFHSEFESHNLEIGYRLSF